MDHVLDVVARHPSPIHTFFEWILFGKIQGSDVVDVDNMTLEEDVLKYLIGSRQFYAAVYTYCR